MIGPDKSQNLCVPPFLWDSQWPLLCFNLIYYNLPQKLIFLLFNHGGHSDSQCEQSSVTLCSLWF